MEVSLTDCVGMLCIMAVITQMIKSRDSRSIYPLSPIRSSDSLHSAATLRIQLIWGMDCCRHFGSTRTVFGRIPMARSKRSHFPDQTQNRKHAILCTKSTMKSNEPHSSQCTGASHHPPNAVGEDIRRVKHHFESSAARIPWRECRVWSSHRIGLVIESPSSLRVIVRENGATQTQ